MTDGNTIEVEADTIDSAIEAALAQLGVGRDQVEVEVLNEASRGLFGLGGRPARVRVRVASTAASPTPPPPRAGQADEADDDEQHGQLDAPIDDAIVDRARQLLAEIVSLTGIEASVTARNDGDHVSLDLEGDTSGLLIGRRGQMLDALEYVVSRILGQHFTRVVHVTVDSQGYRARRQASLEEMARRMGQEAKRRRRPVRLGALSPRERRIVHLVLRTDPGLQTRSSGEGQLRTLVIIPSSAGALRDTEL